MPYLISFPPPPQNLIYSASIFISDFTIYPVTKNKSHEPFLFSSLEEYNLGEKI